MAGEQELTSTGSLTSGPPRRPAPRRRVILAVAACAVLLGLGFAVQRAGSPPARPAATPSSSPAPPPTAAGPQISEEGLRGFAIASDTGSARIVVTSARRLPAGASSPALEVVLHLDVRAGVELLTTSTFAVSVTGGTGSAPATGLTVLDPGPLVQPSDNGFRISAPASVDVAVLMDVPVGEHIVSVLSPTAGRPLAAFGVRG